MPPTATQGHEFTGYYLHEDNGFNSSPNDSTPKAFGADATLDQVEGSNNAVQVFNFGTRTPVDVVERMFDGAWSISFTYTNPWWLRMFFGAPSTTDNGDGSHTHTYSGEEPDSARIIIGRQKDGSERILKGCIASQATVAPQVGGMAQVTIQGAYADEEKNTPGSLESQPTIDHKPMTFADAPLNYSGSAIGYVQQGQVQIQSTVDLVRELSTRVSIDYSPKELIPQVNFTKINEAGGTTNLQRMYGDSTATTVQEDVTNRDAMSLVLDNATSAGSGINKATFSFTGTFPNTYAENGLGDPTADVTEDINRLTESLSVDATNETSTAE